MERVVMKDERMKRNLVDFFHTSRSRAASGEDSGRPKFVLERIADTLSASRGLLRTTKEFLKALTPHWYTTGRKTLDFISVYTSTVFLAALTDADTRFFN